jgi:DNA helicase II / ATP-dependent DNA helicase PcrA
MPPPAPVATSFPGPDALGRGVVVAPRAATPPGFAQAPRLVIDDEVLATPAHAAAFLHDRWLRRERVVIELATDNDALRAPEVSRLAPHQLPPDHVFARERLHTLLWANAYDLRRGEPRWWHGVLAQRRGGTPPPGDVGDVVLPDGCTAWVDGGPRGPLARPLTGRDELPLVHRESVALGRLTVQGDAAPRDALAPDQLAAVTHRAGPARIIAPAGSGKTRVLTARLRHLLRDRRVEPELVTAVAYNTRAAAEMRERTADLVGPDGRGPSIRTLHSLALWICNLDERREVIQERDVRALLDRLVRTARIPNQDPFQPYLEALAEVRLALRDPAEVEAVRGDVDGFAELFDRYREELAARRVVDFDEQIYRAIELLLTRPELRQRAQQVGTHLLVDEFQDLTPAFLLLVRLVAGPTMQVFAVGDDDQTIYSYAGATPQYLVDFDRWFPGAEHHALEVNYRCPPAAVDAAVTLLGHNRVRVDKAIHSGQAADPDGSGQAAGADGTGSAADVGGAGGTPRAGASGLAVHTVASDAAAARAVALVTDRLEAPTASTEQVAVLARVNSALLPVQVALTEAGVPHTAPLDTTVLGRTGVRTALAYLRLGLDLERMHREDVLDTINRPARKVKSAVQPLLPRGRTASIRQLEQLVDQLDGSHQDRFAGYLGDLRHLEAAITHGAETAACLRLIRDRIGLGEAMDALDSSRTRPEGSSHGDDLDALEQLAALHPEPATFREWLTDRLRVPGHPDGVTLSTVHRVKGMEWDHVVVFAANAGLFPHRLADDVEEERRIFHVAVTRCREHVDVVADRARTSPFVGELTRPADRPDHRRAGAVTAGATGGSRASSTDSAAAPPAAVTPTRREDGAVVAVAGLEVQLPGGFVGRVAEVDGGVAVVVARLGGGAGTGAGEGDGGAGSGAGEVDGGAGSGAGEVDGRTATRLRVPFGSPVTVAGRRTTLGAPPRRSGAGGLTARRTGLDDGPGTLRLDGEEPAVDDALYEALRAWRARIAAQSGVPAYLVFHDRHLQVIAGRKPRSVRELAGCPGVGPTKLERYGDDVLDVVEAHV